MNCERIEMEINSKTQEIIGKINVLDKKIRDFEKEVNDFRENIRYLIIGNVLNEYFHIGDRSSKYLIFIEEKDVNKDTRQLLNVIRTKNIIIIPKERTLFFHILSSISKVVRCNALEFVLFLYVTPKYLLLRENVLIGNIFDRIDENNQFIKQLKNRSLSKQIIIRIKNCEITGRSKLYEITHFCKKYSPKIKVIGIATTEDYFNKILEIIALNS